MCKHTSIKTDAQCYSISIPHCSVTNNHFEADTHIKLRQSASPDPVQSICIGPGIDLYDQIVAYADSEPVEIILLLVFLSC